jgi:uncharacterized protein (TIGR02444 family)
LWDYALALYRRAGVEGACLELQEHHDLDVTLVLWSCWLGEQGIALERDRLARIEALCSGWRQAAVGPLRAVRAGLKARVQAPSPDTIEARWPELAAALRRRVLALELASERLELLLLAELAAGLPPAPAGLALAARNLDHCWRFVPADRSALRHLLGAAFPEAAPAQVAAAARCLARSR